MNNYFVSVYNDISQFPTLTHLHVAISKINKFNRVTSKKQDVQIDQKLKKKLAGCAREQDYVILSCTLFLEFIGASNGLDSGFFGPFALSTKAKTILLLPFSMELNLARGNNLEISVPKNIN